MYKVGAFHERRLLEKFREATFEGIRAAGSSCPDLVVCKDGKSASIECKYTRSAQIFLKRDNIARLLAFSEASGSPAFAALKFGRSDWLFIPATRLGHVAKGTGHTIKKQWAGAEGLAFHYLISNWGHL